MTVRNKILPVITSEDISRYPDQASYKINSIVQQLRSETIEREEGESSGGAALQQEIQDRIDADTGLSERIDNEALTRATDDGALQNGIDNLQNQINNLIDVFYPVGSYYETSNSSFNPNTTWGGTWVLDSKGRVTVSKTDSGTFATLGDTGGEEKHTLTQGELPVVSGSAEFSHNFVRNLNNADIITSVSGAITAPATTNRQIPYIDQYLINSGQTLHDKISLSFGNGESHNNLQPYIVVNRWHRIA